MLVGFSGTIITGRAIALITWMLSVGQMPALRNADYMLFSVNALSNATLKIGQKKDLVIITVPVLSSIIRSSSIK